MTEAKLSREEIQRQLDLIEPLRQTHSLEIIHSGLAERAISSTALINFNAIHSDPSPDTLFYPFRTRLDSIPMFQLLKILREFNLDPTAYRTNTEDAFDVISHIAGNDNAPSYGLVLGRYEKKLNGSLTMPYQIGLALGSESSTTLASDLVPIEGVLENDLVMIQRQLTEVAIAKEQLGLAVIDSVTLTDDPEVVGYY